MRVGEQAVMQGGSIQLDYTLTSTRRRLTVDLTLAASPQTLCATEIDADLCRMSFPHYDSNRAETAWRMCAGVCCSCTAVAMPNLSHDQRASIARRATKRITSVPLLFKWFPLHLSFFPLCPPRPLPLSPLHKANRSSSPPLLFLPRQSHGP